MLLLTMGFEQIFSGKYKTWFYLGTGVLFVLVDLFAIYVLLFGLYHAA